MEGGKQKSQAQGQERIRKGKLLLVGSTVLWLSAAGGMSRPSLARTHEGQGPKIAFTVRVYNHARVARDVLSSAEYETDSIFRSASLQITWIDCPIKGEQLSAYPACQADFAPADLIMKIITPEIAAKYSWPRMEMGYAVTNCTPDLSACWGAVSYYRVQDLALRANVSPALVLGIAMAHELGHLLLGPGHSDTGIMRAEFGDRDFAPSRLFTLVFLTAQRERLRAGLAAARTTISTVR